MKKFTFAVLLAFGTNLSNASNLSQAPQHPIYCFAGATSDGKKISFQLSSEIHDPYAWDPDDANIALYQSVPFMNEDGAQCSTTFEHNGRYFIGCSELLYIVDSANDEVIEGKVFRELRRFNSHGELIVAPLASFRFQKISCE